ncbi:hypothetical protein [Priestia filamentosa]|uniref:hypothetical protein n=1 Tax=Priestia filamentosa TaxID=1402861 RepID=UPI000A08B071|nr:hypothetical protein [Priestia filamentosa]MDT3761773.1 hypothetical protein [Priestia filamentosa]WCM16868.1 hypothetical protein PGN40_05835 [Priestia filamentosa]WRU96285.1 hypothetical protein RYX51_04175 [Priestia filamentosa]SMF45120.1 hypothetical protein SAMN06296056_103293 [Priestia filamentosa]
MNYYVFTGTSRIEEVLAKRILNKEEKASSHYFCLFWDYRDKVTKGNSVCS